MESEQGKAVAEMLLISPSSSSHQPNPNPKPRPKRFVKNQIPDSILNDPLLNAAISILPSNYNFEIHKSVWRVLSTGAKRVTLQFPEGLLMYSLSLSDIFTTFAAVTHCYILGDVTYGTCCVDDFAAAALGADLLIHYGHSCLVPIDATMIPCLYIFVDIKIDVPHFVDTVRLNLESRPQTLVVAGTIQFASAIRAAKPQLEELGFRVLVPQAKPLSAGEVLGCTAELDLRKLWPETKEDKEHRRRGKEARVSKHCNVHKMKIQRDIHIHKRKPRDSDKMKDALISQMEETKLRPPKEAKERKERKERKQRKQSDARKAKVSGG